MSDCAAKKFSEKEEFQIWSSQSDLGKSSYRKHSLSMAHWTRASSSAEPESDKSCSPFEEISDVGYSKDCGSLPLELTKARMAERLMLGVSNADAYAGNTRQFSSKMWGVTHNVCQGVECRNVDPVRRAFDSTMVEKNVNLYAADTVVSERFSVHKISDISVNLYYKEGVSLQFFCYCSHQLREFFHPPIVPTRHTRPENSSAFPSTRPPPPRATPVPKTRRLFHPRARLLHAMRRATAAKPARSRRYVLGSPAAIRLRRLCLPPSPQSARSAQPDASSPPASAASPVLSIASDASMATHATISSRDHPIVFTCSIVSHRVTCPPSPPAARHSPNSSRARRRDV